jgi:hypothetical protein
MCVCVFDGGIMTAFFFLLLSSFDSAVFVPTNNGSAHVANPNLQLRSDGTPVSKVLHIRSLPPGVSEHEVCLSV